MLRPLHFTTGSVIVWEDPQETAPSILNWTLYHMKVQPLNPKSLLLMWISREWMEARILRPSRLLTIPSFLFSAQTPAENSCDPHSIWLVMFRKIRRRDCRWSSARLPAGVFFSAQTGCGCAGAPTAHLQLFIPIVSLTQTSLATGIIAETAAIDKLFENDKADLLVVVVPVKMMKSLVFNATEGMTLRNMPSVILVSDGFSEAVTHEMGHWAGLNISPEEYDEYPPTACLSGTPPLRPGRQKCEIYERADRTFYRAGHLRLERGPDLQYHVEYQYNLAAV